jgi:hypothetical protein
LSGQLPAELHFDAVGTWWNGAHEIDVVAMEGHATTLAGSCKWTNARVGRRELEALRRALTAGAAQLDPAPGCWYALFSRAGFEADLVALAAQPEQRLLLFTPEELFV